MTTYSGLSTSAPRESVSLDEDDLSDVEDEVFIRDGRNGYKFAEDRGVKRPLMAPRRKHGKADIATRLKNRTSCRVFCVPCCYAFTALTVFLGLIVLVIILVSLFPLPLDKFKSWFVSKKANQPIKVLPCTNLEVTDVWNINLPKLATESALRTLDVNSDGTDDIVFGFGLGEDVQLPQQWFCPMFLGTKPPCQGGVIALDGLTGQPLWRRWLGHVVYTIFCTADLNGDKIFDCIVSGKGGVLSAISGHDGTILWEYENNKTSLVMDVYSGSFIPDQDGDGVLDVIASHTLQRGGRREGFILVISGKNGFEFVRVSTPKSAEILFAPQLFVRFDGQNAILFGTGSESTPGALYLALLQDIMTQKMDPIVLYEDKYKGILAPVILVDINGDENDDIVSAMFNSTIVALDGVTLKQIWNFTVNNSETLSTPTPGYFTSDNVTDFLIKYQTGPGFPVYYYSQTIIIDGKTGKPIYNRPIIDSVGTQMGGLTIGVENYGNDMFLYWMADCKDNEARQDTYTFVKGSNIRQQSRADICKLRFNSSMVAKLYSLNQFNEPPGILVYSSENRTELEYNGTKCPLDEVNLYLKENPDFDISFRDSITSFRVNNPNSNRMNDKKYKKINSGSSSFRHRDDGQGLVKEFSRGDTRGQVNTNNNDHTQSDDYYEGEVVWQQGEDLLDGPQLEYSDSFTDDSNIQNRNMKKMLSPNMMENINRDPRSKTEHENETEIVDAKSETPKTYEKRKTDKNSLPEKVSGPNDYRNIFLARNRLLHDLNHLPTDILRDTYFKNRQKQFRNNKFEQRDLRYRETEDEINNKTDDSEFPDRKNINFPESLWDLESEKELEDRENGYWRGKREADERPVGIPKITSTGVLLEPLSKSNEMNAIDIVFATYWIRPKFGAQVLLEKDVECVQQKMMDATASTANSNWEVGNKEEIYTRECLEKRGANITPLLYKIYKNNDELRRSQYFYQISQLTLGQMTVYRLRLECKCQILKPGERCSKIRSAQNQDWSAFMGKSGDGIFKTH